MTCNRFVREGVRGIYRPVGRPLHYRHHHLPHQPAFAGWTYDDASFSSFPSFSPCPRSHYRPMTNPAGCPPGRSTAAARCHAAIQSAWSAAIRLSYSLRNLSHGRWRGRAGPRCLSGDSCGRVRGLRDSGLVHFWCRGIPGVPGARGLPWVS